MTKCENCKNKIPDGMKICPHCGLLPPRLFPKFWLYLVLTLIAIGSAAYFRPFADPPAGDSVSVGTLWAAFVIFTVFALIFAFVCLVLGSGYARRSYRGRLTKAEVNSFVAMKKHIEAGHHTYDKGVYCTVCGRKK